MKLARRSSGDSQIDQRETTPGMAIWVQHRQNTSWEPATVVSQSSSNSYWIMQDNGTDQSKMYRRTRSMLKIRCTDVRQPRHDYSQLTENQKAKFQTPYISNEERNSVEHNSVNKIPSDLVSQTKSHTSSVSDPIFSEEREEIAEVFLHLQKTYLYLHPHWRQ